jgi:hypothetical protein
MSAWLRGLGAAALTGSQLLGQRRLQDEQTRQQQFQNDQQIAQMALLRQQAERADAAERRAAQADERGAAVQLLEATGPNGQLDAQGTELLQKTGFGGRVNPGVDLGGVNPIAGLPAETVGTGASLRPTAQQQVALDATAAQQRAVERQERAAKLLEDPGYWNRPYVQRQQLWTAAGQSGQAPQTPQEVLELAQQQHGLRMKEIGAMYPADRFGLDSKQTKSPMEKWTDDFQENLRQQIYMNQARLQQVADDPAESAALQRQLMELATRMTGPRPGAEGMAAGHGGAPADGGLKTRSGGTFRVKPRGN